MAPYMLNMWLASLLSDRLAVSSQEARSCTLFRPYGDCSDGCWRCCEGGRQTRKNQATLFAGRMRTRWDDEMRWSQTRSRMVRRPTTKACQCVKGSLLLFQALSPCFGTVPCWGLLAQGTPGPTDRVAGTLLLLRLPAARRTRELPGAVS